MLTKREYIEQLMDKWLASPEGQAQPLNEEGDWAWYEYLLDHPPYTPSKLYTGLPRFGAPDNPTPSEGDDK